MMVYQLVNDKYPGNNIDIFAKEPFDFDIEYKKAKQMEISTGLFVPFVNLTTLINMKENAGRDKDLIAAKQLRKLLDLENEK